MKQTMVGNLTKVASQTKQINPAMSEDLDRIAKQVASILSDEELDSIVDTVEKKAAQEKEAKLINGGDIVICVDNFGPLFKGRRYIVSDASMPGYLCVQEDTGEDVGVFAINRFVLDNNEQ
ncbi:MAG: hypothetical protein PHF86_04155 [Candidatus Nanoarchaeia archaeon]|jgi:transcription antitermination factor NusG|nr:hypothetical protein [Candidatus Nanoarchaeia archaeon]